MSAASLILQAYKREVRESQQWLKQHRQDCVQCSRSAGRKPANPPCPSGQRIQRYIEDNQAIAAQLSAPPPYEQPALFELDELTQNVPRPGGSGGRNAQDPALATMAGDRAGPGYSPGVSA